ncbi:tetratricopeptide repeat protein [Actinomadura sp. NTSP31]|uniref:tetratricopeptide repeat protein n=1 Tax=Actinomadura sp. NTSP31 TaxID=1735447 RepID=UPI0035BFE3B5
MLEGLGAVLLRRGRTAEAERILTEVLAGRTRLMGADHPATLVAQRLLAEVLAVRDHRSDAIDLLSNVLLSQSETLEAERGESVEAEHGDVGCRHQGPGKGRRWREGRRGRRGR